jgi:hypothetical protein
LKKDLELFDTLNSTDNDNAVDIIPENYFLEDDQLTEQVESLHHFIKTQMEQNNTFANTKINVTALGFPDLYAFRQIFSGYGDTIKRDAVCSGCQVFLGMLVHQVS